MIELPRQPLAERILRAHLAADNPPQQLLFHGPAGAGKRRAAREVAWELVDPGGRHDPDEIALDITIVSGSGQVILRDDLTEPMADLAARPLVYEKRVLVIDEAARLVEDESAPQILKTLEEPPPRATLILVSDHPGELLPTIRSRCHPVPFRFPGWAELDANLDQFTRQMRAVGVGLGLAVLGGDASPALVVAGAQAGMEQFADANPSQKLASLRDEAERVEGKRGGKTAARRSEDQQRRERRRAVTDGWTHALDGWLGLVADALALSVGAEEPQRHPEHAAALREVASGEGAPRRLERTAEEIQQAQGQLALNPTTDLSIEALIVRIGDIGTPRERPLLPPGRLE